MKNYMVKEKRNVPYAIKRRNRNWIGHILHRNCLQQHAIEGKVELRLEVTGRRNGKREQLLNELKEISQILFQNYISCV
jgi:hypothetical protein